MHQRKSKKILLYFFLLFAVGSINNLTFKDYKFKKIQDIKISGLNNSDKEKIHKKIYDLKSENIFFLNRAEIVEVINSDPLVESFNVFKKYPSTLHINIKETNLVAKINKDGKIFYIGTNGKLSEKNFFAAKIPFIFGKPNVQEFLNFKKKIDQSEFSYKQIENLYFFPSKRWDIELRNKIILKLPRENVRNVLDDVFRLLKNDNFNNIKTIDARVKNQIILND